MNEEETRKYVDGLRELADYIEANPNIAEKFSQYDTAWLYPGWGHDLATLAEAVKTGGKWVKGSSEYYYWIEREFGPHAIRFQVDRMTACEKIVTGKETVKVLSTAQEEEIAAAKALIRDIQAAPEVEKETEVTEWVCPPSLLALGEKEEE